MRFPSAALLLLLLSSCGVKDPSPTPESKLVVYATATRAAAVPGVATMGPSNDGPIASPTPFSYTVLAGDTMSGIAERFNVSLNDLQAANPTVSATGMSIGTRLLIPSSQGSGAESTPTPEPLGVDSGACFAYGDGGSWCLVVVRNDGTGPVENVIAQIQIVDATGVVVADQTAALLLDILRPGAELALAAYFPDTATADLTLRVRILSATRLSPGEARYLPITIRGPLVEVLRPGYTARVSGQVSLPAGEQPAGTIWLAATAFDRVGRPVGVRRWESKESLPPGASLPFSFNISSLGAEIERVALAAEARP